MTFGDFIRQKRIDKGMFLREVAERTGFTISMLSKIETNDRMPAYPNPGSRTLRLAEALEIDPKELAFRARLARGWVLGEVRNLTDEEIRDAMEVEEAFSGFASDEQPKAED